MEPHFDLSGRKVYVAGHRGMVGSAIVRRLASEDCEVVTAPRSELDLSRQADVEAWVAEHKPGAVFLAAATVGGILANSTRPAEFLYDNLIIEANIIETDVPINVGTGTDVSILELAEIIKRVVGYEGEFSFDRTKPDGTPRKLLDVSRLSALGWRPRIALEGGIRSTYEWYCKHGSD